MEETERAVGTECAAADAGLRAENAGIGENAENSRIGGDSPNSKIGGESKAAGHSDDPEIAAESEAAENSDDSRIGGNPNDSGIGGEPEADEVDSEDSEVGGEPEAAENSEDSEVDSGDSEAEGESEAGEGGISFADLGLDDFILEAIERKGFRTPSPIQVLAIPRLLGGDANIIAKARTGTGKTAAFGLPIVQRVHEAGDRVRALVLEPTRELAVQTCAELRSFSSSRYPRVAVLYGGAPYGQQIRELRGGVEIVVGTPGRVIDHIERGTLSLSGIDYFILDEGDEMLDMGFVDDIERIFAASNPSARILLFSATMPRPILSIAERFMGDYEVCEEEGFVEEPLLIEQKYTFVREADKTEALVRLIDVSPDFYGLVFTQTKTDADNLQRALDERGYDCAALHGDIPQAQREKILARFRARKTRVLVATDVAARGIDVAGLTHVVNYSLPFDGATYVHRIGRTGRAGTSGTAVTFVRPEERRRLEFLRSSVRRAAKGEMAFAPVPTVEETLSAVRARLLAELKREGDAAEADDGIAEIARELLSSKGAEEVVEGLLRSSFGARLSPSRYGRIEEIRSERPERRKGGARPGAKRLFVQLGRRDGFNAREIATYLSSLLRIPGRQVDDIRVAETFSLVSLPDEAADRVLEMSRRDSSLPHVHIDVRRPAGPRPYANRGEGRGRFGDERRPGDERRFGGSRAPYRRGGRDGNARPRVHTPTDRRGASSYKKPRKDEF